MSSSPPSTSGPPSGLSPSITAPKDPLFLETLMSRLQLRPPFLDTNSFLSHSLDDFLLRSLLSESDAENDEDADDADGDEDVSGGADENRRRALAKEEAKLEKEIVRIIRSGGADDALKPNSGQSVSIGDHNICLAFQEEPGSEYRVWEWHGHIMLFDYEDGYSAEYICGNYFERMAERKKHDGKKKKKNEEEEGASRDLGLRDLIADPKDSNKAGNDIGRVLHRNSLNGTSAAAR